MKTQKLIYKFSELIDAAKSIAAENIADKLDIEIPEGYKWSRTYDDYNFYTKDGELVE